MPVTATPTSRVDRYATGLTLLACLAGGVLLPYAPGFLPGETPGRLGLLQQLFTWWPLALLAAFGSGLWIPRLRIDSALRKLLVVLQWLLTLASLALLMVSMYLVFVPRAG